MPRSRCLIAGGLVWSGDSRAPAPSDILVESGVVTGMRPPGDPPPDGFEVVDVSGTIIFPALCDLHTHLRDPGHTAKETLQTGVQAALRGGFSVVCAMPNTDPVMDQPEILSGVACRVADLNAPVRVLMAAAATIGQLGTEPSDMEALCRAGAAFFTDDGHGIGDENAARRGLVAANRLGRFVMEHCEDPHIRYDAVIHPGRTAMALGLDGMPVESETRMLGRDLRLCNETGAHLHVAHVSSAQSVAMIGSAKRRGVAVTAEVNPHHLILDETHVFELAAMAKVNPPLRSETDRAALLDGLKSGVIDCLATDHAPHTLEEKSLPFAQAPCGLTGLETAWSALHTHLVLPGLITWDVLVSAFAERPRRILGLGPITLAPGSPAEFFAFDPNARWTVTPSSLASLGKNTPFLHRELQGRVRMTFAGGTAHVHHD